MQKDTILSIIRTLLTLLGTYLIGHSLFGLIVDQNNWEIVGGAAISFIGIMWGILDKSANVEKVQSLVRSIIISIGGLLVAAGKTTGQTVELVIGLIVPITTLIQSYTSKVKVQQIHSGQVKTSQTGSVVRSIMILILCSAIYNGYSQVITKAVPKLSVPVISVSIPKLDSGSFYAFRPVLGLAAYAQPGNQLMTGAGIGYQHLVYDYDAQKWNAQVSYSLVGWVSKSLQADDPKNITFAFGPAIGFFNNLIIVGGAYDVGHGQWIGTLALGISLNN